MFKHLISASDTKKEHLNDRVENSVRWTVMCSKKGAVTDKSQPRHKKYTQFYREEGVFFGIIYV